MKKFLLIITVFSLSFSALAQTQGTLTPADIYGLINLDITKQTTFKKTAAPRAAGKTLSKDLNFDWNSSTSAWDSTYRSTYTYNTNSTINITEEMDLTTNTWVNSSRQTIYGDYNAGLFDSLVAEMWDPATSAWVTSFKAITKFRTNGLLEEISIYVDLMGTGSLMLIAYQKAYLNSSNQMIAYITKSLDFMTFTMQNSDSAFYALDANGNTLEETVFTWDASSNIWLEYSRTINVYNTNNDLLTSIYQLYDGSAFENAFKRIYTYNAQNNIQQEVSQDWDFSTNTWMDSERMTYTYDANNLNTSIVFESYFNSTWTLDERMTNTYDLDGDITVETYEYHDGTMWVNSNRAQYFYVEGVGISEVNTIDVVAFPNPSNGMVTVKLPQNTKNAEVKIYNNAGIIFLNESVEEHKIFDLSSFPAGIYFIDVKAANGAALLKVIKK